jgi:predicted HicB family RNase H-like nuclease
MSDAAKTRTVRVDDELWEAIQAQAKIDGITVTSIVINAFYDYLKGARNRQESVIE